MMPHVYGLQHRITSGYIHLISETGQRIPAFWAHPQQGGPFPGIVMLHDDRGLNGHSRALVHRFAEVGYYIIAPDLFEGQNPTSQGEADALERFYLAAGPAKVAAALRALESHHKCNKKMAVLGWDYGGTLVYDVACRRSDVMATVAFYGNPTRWLGHFDEASGPILAIFGEFDEIGRATEAKLREELIRTGRPHEVVVFPNAKHGFYNDTLDTYDPQSSEEAWQATLAFLETHQGKPPAPPDATGSFSPGQIY
jgi:carboxymethylenebutenolidase